MSGGHAEPAGDAADYARAALNILDDAAAEKTLAQDTHRAILNILADAEEEKELLQQTHKATLNLLEDFEAEKTKAEAAHRSLLQEITDRLKAEQEVRVKTRANLELEEALSRLKEAQAQLVQSEKLASLGGMVAGIAHEINTPVGVCVTAASSLKQRASVLGEQFRGQALKQRDLEFFIRVAEESTDILLRNLQRAADLISSFKQVAVDEASGEKRHFALKGYIDEVLLTLRPFLKNTSHQVEVSCPDNVVLHTYPGAIAQILTNFVTNSVTHAFDGRKAGRIRITVTQEHEVTTLRYADDGCGISDDNMSRIFDPFFTTRRAKGGSGLGLHIVYNLVTQLLGGRIAPSSTIGQGTEFVITLPSSTASDYAKKQGPRR